MLCGASSHLHGQSGEVRLGRPGWGAWGGRRSSEWVTPQPRESQVHVPQGTVI